MNKSQDDESRQVNVTRQPAGGFFARPLYPMRIFASSACIALGSIYVWNYKTFHFWYLVLLLLTLVYPHVSRYIAGQLERRKKFELGTSLFDAFILGSTIYVVGFSHIPTLSLMTVALANGMALGSISFMSLSAVAVAFGMVLSMMFYGVNYMPRDLLMLNVLSAAVLLLYFNMFALVAYKRSVLLQQSRRALREQKNIIEIEKRKSENLLWALLPASVATELETRNSVETRLHDDATLLIADIREFNRIARETDPGRLLADINHCFKAFDQIVHRHHLEPLRTVGDAFFAVAGIPVESATHAADAVNAAIEMRDFMAQYNQSRHAVNKPPFDFCFVVHSGPLISGLVETRKFTFDIWGDTVVTAAIMEHTAEGGEVTISETTLEKVTEDLVTRAAGTVRSKTGKDITLYTIQHGRGAEHDL